MREILFRGKRKDNGDWATATSIFKAECVGELRFYINSLSDATVYLNSDGNITRTETELDCEWLEVIQETVGQFTGLTDKNGKKIFEGDIVALRTSRTHEVKYADGGFYMEGTAIPMRHADKFEVIGNIHDNPELLEGGVS